jgi:hypothetical protein
MMVSIELLRSCARDLSFVLISVGIFAVLPIFGSALIGRSSSVLLSLLGLWIRRKPLKISFLVGDMAAFHDWAGLLNALITGLSADFDVYQPLNFCIAASL